MMINFPCSRIPNNLARYTHPQLKWGSVTPLTLDVGFHPTSMDGRREEKLPSGET